MSVKTFKPLPIGNEDFAALREKGIYYVDKTSYLKTVFTHPAPVMLFTRPRRFGKTMLMDMFAKYLTIAEDGSTGRERKEKLFDGLKISADKEFTDKYMGQFPVISISLKRVYGDEFKYAYEKLALEVFTIAQKFKILLDSDKITGGYKEILRHLNDLEYLKDLNNRTSVESSLNTLSVCLHQHYGKKVILLIDEYDVPLSWAAEKGYHPQMVTLIRQFFEIMKISPENKTTSGYPIEKLVLTGCPKVVNNSIYTGISNIFPNTVLSTIVILIPFSALPKMKLCSF